ncbi:acylphosphatase [Candidatus Magnetomorum sp. HK-1]|nr:acylphosphatase [Candidatus Magnetomorum sp. HK-1]
MEPVKCHVRISGIVQGVCYRMETRRAARQFGVKGWVKNMPDGTVEGVFEGAKDAVDKLIDWCYSGPPHAKVNDVSTSWEDNIENFESFEIVY